MLVTAMHEMPKALFMRRFLDGFPINLRPSEVTLGFTMCSY